MAEAPFDLNQAHRWFGVEFNNQAWQLVEAAHRSAEEVARMVHMAHASTLHWLQVGTAINHLRGQCLLATAYAIAGHGDAAVRHANECLALSEKTKSDLTPFDRATVHGCAAQAYSCAGRQEEARTHHSVALEAANALEHPSEKKLFEQLYSAL